MWLGAAAMVPVPSLPTTTCGEPALRLVSVPPEGEDSWVVNVLVAAEEGAVTPALNPLSPYLIWQLSPALSVIWVRVIRWALPTVLITGLLPLQPWFIPPALKPLASGVVQPAGTRSVRLPLLIPPAPAV